MTRFRRNPEVVYRPEGLDGALLFDPDTAQVQVVNLTGAYVWEQLDGATELDAVCARVQAQFDDAPPELADEVRSFVGTLVKLGLAGEVLE